MLVDPDKLEYKHFAMVTPPTPFDRTIVAQYLEGLMADPIAMQRAKDEFLKPHKNMRHALLAATMKEQDD